MFNVGDIVRCSNSRYPNTSSHLYGLMFSQRFEIVRTVDWSDGSQSLWVVARSLNPKRLCDQRERGPYCHLRFELEARSDKYQYDPNQTGDTDEDI